MILNEIQVQMGGESRTIRYSMISSQRLMADMQKGLVLNQDSNSVGVVLYLLDLGLRNKPENYSKELLEKWVDEMSFDEYDKAKDFAFQAMGFILQQEMKTGQSLQGMMKEMDLPVG